MFFCSLAVKAGQYLCRNHLHIMTCAKDTVCILFACSDSDELPSTSSAYDALYFAAVLSSHIVPPLSCIGWDDTSICSSIIGISIGIRRR